MNLKKSSPLCFSREEKTILKNILRLAKAQSVKLYLVGGALRDKFLGRQKENPDFDFCLKKKAIGFGRKLAASIGAGFVVLDKAHGACRLVKKIKDKTYTLDFTDFRGKTLQEDLLLRDFTINTLALEIETVFSKTDLKSHLIDLYNARADIAAGIVKVPEKDAFNQDPLRILRAFSFACLLGFSIDKETLRLIKLAKARLADVSFERIRDELFKILESEPAFVYFMMLDNLKILKILFPEIEKMRNVGQGPYHHLDIWGHSLETLKQMEKAFKELKNDFDIQEYLEEVIAGDRKRKALLKFCAIFHDIGKPKSMRIRKDKITFYGHERIGLDMVHNIAKRLKLSGNEISLLRKVVLCHLRPGYLADNQAITQRAMFRYFRDTASEAVSILLLSLADQRATKGEFATEESRRRHEKLVFKLIKEYFRRKKEKKLPRLIDGHVLLKEFKLKPSPLIGEILREVEELQAIGKVTTRQEALEVAAKHTKKR